MRLATIAALAMLATPALAQPLVSVEKTATCGCCAGWIEHMKSNGFEVEATDVSPEALDATKARLGVAPEHRSCHTAVVDGYVIEGHVPASDVERLLRERPDARGLAAPGMPVGSPGMEVAGAAKDYDVLLLGSDGEATVFETHP